MMIKNIHEKLSDSIQIMLVNPIINIPFYGEFNLQINFHEQESIGTCAVNMTAKGMNFYYSPTFLNRLSQKEVNFVVLHENFHLLFNHPQRTQSGAYNHKLANIVQDMIINHVIVEDISHFFIEIPKDEKGKNMALFVPKEYEGELIFEELYEWMRDKKEKRDKEREGKCNGKCGGNSDGSGDGECKSGCNCSGNNPGENSYGPYGKNPKGDNGGAIDTWSLDHILDNMDTNEGEYLDKHISDDIEASLRESMISDVINRLSARGLNRGKIVDTLGKLRKNRKDYLKYIKRTISNVIFGHLKQRTITRPNRKGIPGFKGFRKIKTKINVILDTSGSMGGLHVKILEYVHQNDISMNLIEADTEVTWVEEIKNTKKLESIKLAGFGGTVLQPAVNYVQEKFNDFNTVILTDGYCDSLDFSSIKGRVLIISCGQEAPIINSNGKIKQIVVDMTLN